MKNTCKAVLKMTQLDLHVMVQKHNASEAMGKNNTEVNEKKKYMKMN